MPEPFKNFFNPEMIAQMGAHLCKASPDFDQSHFVRLATRGLDALELKERSAQITQALNESLSNDFRAACSTMIGALHPVEDAELGDMAMDQNGIRGWAIMPMADFVAAKGLDDFGHALDVLAEMTKRFSAEFAVRHFFVHDQKRALEKASQWAKDENTHVRRLASEGSRPRLPWGIQLTDFVNDPSPLLPLLESLKNDKSEYVRRSIANNINDIAKDHPDVVAGIAKNWLEGADNNQVRMIKHACRSLIKQGHKPTLAALGYGLPKVSVENFEIHNPDVQLGGALEFTAEIKSEASIKQPLIIDFNIHHKMANGEQSPKTFKWKILELEPGQSVKITKKHAIKPITTRKYYAGSHALELQINGKVYDKLPFELTL